VDFWMYVQRNDGELDVVQIGNHPYAKERYISHKEIWGPACWLNGYHTDHWRPTDYIYAKRCPEKNPEFIPPMTDEDKKKLNEESLEKQYPTSKENQLKVLREALPENEYEEMITSAEKQGIVKIPVDKPITYDDAQALCTENGCVLPTLEELQNSKLKEGDSLSFYMYVRRED